MTEVAIFVVGNIVYYVINGQLVAYTTVKKLSETTQTTTVDTVYEE
jgi:hypothetical protein